MNHGFPMYNFFQRQCSAAVQMPNMRLTPDATVNSKPFNLFKARDQLTLKFCSAFATKKIATLPCQELKKQSWWQNLFFVSSSFHL